MSDKIETISVRTTRLNHIILGQSERTSKFVQDCLSREGLLDILCLVYDESSKDGLQKKDKNISDFVKKYRPVINETKLLRVNLNDFEVKTIIGKGYFGDVHLVAEKSSGDVYAMKKIKKISVGTSQVKEERDIMAWSESEWITSLQYAFQDPDYLYLIMEYLPGGDLLSLMIRNGAFDEDLARFYLAELTLALNALHSMGFAHRDVKPENILLDRCGHLKLADFGNAAALNKDGTVTSLSPVGTPDYIAPELLETLNSVKVCTAKHDVTCDFWSMGVIGYELITEETPFHANNVFETYTKILNHCKNDNGQREKKLTYPNSMTVSTNFKNLIDKLITKPNKRLTYSQILKHPYFENISWDNLRYQVPPIIPSVSGDDDTSNFEDVDKNKNRNTYNTKALSSLSKGNEFSGENLPFLGYSFVNEDFPAEINRQDTNNEFKATKLNAQIQDMEKTINEQKVELKNIQEDLLNAERKAIQTDSLNKILKETKSELHDMKDTLKEKIVELASSRTEVKTLKSYLKIEEDSRLKNESTIADVLSSTYQKWEKAKNFSDKNYEKQISEKKNDITNLNEKLRICDGELKTKINECDHLQATISNYKDLLKNSKEQNNIDKIENDKNRAQLIDTYELKIQELKNKLKTEKDCKHKQVDEMKELRKELDDSICSSISVSEIKRSSDKNITDMKIRLNKQIEENNVLRDIKAKIERSYQDLQKQFNENQSELLKFKNKFTGGVNSNRSSDANSSDVSLQYQTAHGSLTDLDPHVEEQLRNDLLLAKENENLQRQKVESSQEMIKRLEDVISKFNQHGNSDILEKQNEKLEDKLAAVREQAILERQSARTANLSLWKLEKQLEDVTLEKKTIARRLEQTEEKMIKMKEEKLEAEMKSRQNRELIFSKEKDIKDLKKDIENLKLEIKKEHERWEKSEKERSKEKLEIVENISKIHKLEDTIEDGKRKIISIQQKNDSLSLENMRIQKELSEQRDGFNQANDVMGDLEQDFNAVKRNYNMLKEACIITEAQLTEIENMLDAEVKQNKSNCDKIDDLWSKLREKDDDIMKLRQELNDERTVKITAESKTYQLQTELDETRDTLDTLRKQFIEQQEELINKTSNLYQTQEKLELISSDASNLQRVNINFDQELIILKEENTKVLTDLFLAKEETNKLMRELKESKKQCSEFKHEVEHLNVILAEQKTYYSQRDIKAEATMSQHKKLIEYLQAKVEEYQQKKKKNLADILFGTNSSSKKENLPPPMAIEGTLAYKRLQEELKREKGRNNQLTEQLLRAKTDIRASKVLQDDHHEVIGVEETKVIENIERETNQLTRKETYTVDFDKSTTQNHRFEMTLENSNNFGSQFITCSVCHKQIIVGQPYWKCKECKTIIHRKCRSNVSMICEGIEIIEKYEEKENMEKSEKEIDVDRRRNDGNNINYTGDCLFKIENMEHKLQINTIYEINEDTILLGCESGMYSYHLHNKNLVHITGIKSVNYIAVTQTLAKAILIGSNGEHLYQCDLRHLQSRGQASAFLKPKLDVSILDLPFANRVTSERWHLAKVHGDNDHIPDAFVIAATSSRILILRYDIMLGRFKPVRALDTATGIQSILFTRHTAIVSSDKFFEIDLTSFTAEEFLDMSDTSVIHARGCEPMAAFRINKQEFLLCFKEFGIFVDEYGCRSRPDDLNWVYNPTGFIYREPILFISHTNIVQVLRINKSYSRELELKNSEESSSDSSSTNKSEMRAFLNIPSPKLITEAGKLGVYVLTKTENNLQEVIVVDGLKAIKSHLNSSLETISSSMTSLPLATATSSDTILTCGTESEL